MPVTLTTKDFISKATQVHGDRYDYSKAVYVGRHSKLTIICKVHGEYEQDAGNHLQGQNCPKCVLNATSKRLQYTTNIFINKACEVYGDAFTYEKSNYIDSRTPLVVTCKVHGEVCVQPVRFLRGFGCPKCNGIFVTDTSSFIEAAQAKYKDAYTYDKVVFVNAKTKVSICCATHGMFSVTPDNFLHKSSCGCAKCSKEQQRKQQAEIFLSRAHDLHGNKYDYSLVKYARVDRRVDIICPVHGVFKQLVSVHLKGCGCPKCRSSSGETEIRVFLEKHQQIYAQEYSIPECRDKGMLHFDFALFDQAAPEKLIALIEYDGEHHYKAISMWGDSVYLEDIQRRDAIKNQFCEDNNIPLLRIPYWDKDKIPEKLKTFLKELV